MPTFTTLAKRSIRLSGVLGKGGEGIVYEVTDDSHQVAKIYHPAYRNIDRERKLKAMVINPPQDDTRKLSPPHISIAWPTDLLYEQGRFVGYLMPRIIKSPDIFEIYNPKLRAQKHSGFSWRHLHRVAKNLATALNALHARHYVMGDINQKNVLVTASAMVTLVDTDSFEIRDNAGNVYACAVGVPEYVPPELQGISLDSVRRNSAHDNFGLAVMIFQLLMEGFHPFTGAPKDPTISLVGQVYLHCIKTGIFPYQTNRDFAPPPASPDFKTLHPEIQKAFLQCFIDGHRNPSARPGARSWINLLAKAETSLVQCEKESRHWYSDHLTECAWCQRERARAKARVASPSPIPLQTPMPTPQGATQPRPISKVGSANRTFSKASLVLGILSVFCTGILTAPFAIGYGMAALLRINRDPAQYGGKNLAVGGLVAGTLALVISGVTWIPFLSALNTGQNRTQPIVTTQRPARERSGAQPRTTPQPIENVNAPATIFGYLEANAYAQGGSPGRFEIRILNGQVSNNRIILQVRETSVNYDGSWAAWSDVIGQTFLRDNLGNTFGCDARQSGGSTGGLVRPGGYREGTLIFPGPIPPNISRITLHFVYFPGHEPIRVSAPMVSGSNPERTAQAQAERPLLEPSPYRSPDQPTPDAAEVHNEAMPHVSRAQAFFEQRQYQAAIDECNEALRMEPRNRDALRLRAQIKKTMAILEPNN